MTISSTTIEAQRRHLTEYHNQARATYGKPPFYQSSTLNSMAQGYANQVADKNWFVADAYHTRPNGYCFAQWWNTKAPAAWRCGSGCTPSCPYAVGENLARGYSNASAVHNAWMNSTGHRANILNRSFKHIGIGIQDSRSGVRYWVVEFLGL